MEEDRSRPSRGASCSSLLSVCTPRVSDRTRSWSCRRARSWRKWGPSSRWRADRCRCPSGYTAARSTSGRRAITTSRSRRLDVGTSPPSASLETIRAPCDGPPPSARGCTTAGRRSGRTRWREGRAPAPSPRSRCPSPSPRSVRRRAPSSRAHRRQEQQPHGHVHDQPQRAPPPLSFVDAPLYDMRTMHERTTSSTSAHAAHDAGASSRSLPMDETRDADV